MANSFTRLGGICSNCCNCCSNIKALTNIKWSLDLTNLGLVNGSCTHCSDWNSVYILSGTGGSTWDYAAPSPFFCRLEDAGGHSIRMWAGKENYSDSVTWIAYSPQIVLNRTPLPSGGCLWSLSFFIASACNWAGDEPAPSGCTGYINQATWQYRAPVGEQCDEKKTLTMLQSVGSPLVQGWASQYECVGCDGSSVDLPNDPQEPESEGSFSSLGPFCSAGPSFSATVQIVPV